jgi:acetyltransferase
MSLDKILNAESVAIVGASKDETKRGFQAIRTLMNEKFKGKLFPVNPKEKEILGFKCYQKVADIDEPVDIALITTPARTIPAILADCGAKGVHGAVIIAGGFGELGQDGRKLEEEMVAVARQWNIRLIGPNTSGMMNLNKKLNLVGLRDTPRGGIALLTQSGNMALTLITEAAQRSRKGFSYYVGVGNEADLKFHEYLQYFGQDADTKAILMYVEGMRQGRDFLQQAYETTLKKPVILFKSGRSSTGKRSAGSHTGALAGDFAVTKGALERAGIIMIENPDELFPAAEILSSLPPLENNNIAILADGGGHATIAADLLSDLGVNMPPLSQDAQAQLKNILPFAASVPNPVDVAGGTDADPSVFADCARIILEDVNIGGLLIVGLFGGYGIRFAESLALKEEDAAHRMGAMLKQFNKPIIVHSLYASANPPALDLLRNYDIPVYDSLSVACKGIGVLAEYGRHRKKAPPTVNFNFNWGAKAQPAVEELIQSAAKQDRQALYEYEAKEMLALHGAPVSQDRLAETAEEAVSIAGKIDGAVALKIVSPDILHKSDAGGVKIQLETEQEICNAFEEIIANAKSYKSDVNIHGVLVSPMAAAGLEVIIGTKMDDQFGPIIMYGLGGVMVEILRDVSFRVLPITPTAARQMIEETKSFPILQGARGRKPYDLKALVELLLICSDLIESYPRIQEMDLNPVIVHETGLSIVDARVILRSDSVD